MQTIDASRGERARKAGVAVRRFEDQLDRRRVIGAELPDPVAESVRAAVQRVLLAGLAVELIGDPVEGEPAIGDPVGEPSRHGAERRRVSEIVLDRVEAEHDSLQPVGGRHDEVAHHRAIGENFRARPRARGDRDLKDRRSADPAETPCAHFVPHFPRLAPCEARSIPIQPPAPPHPWRRARRAPRRRPQRTSLPSARRCWCCSASNDSCRRG